MNSNFYEIKRDTLADSVRKGGQIFLEYQSTIEKLSKFAGADFHVVKSV